MFPRISSPFDDAERGAPQLQIPQQSFNRDLIVMNVADVLKSKFRRRVKVSGNAKSNHTESSTGLRKSSKVSLICKTSVKSDGMAQPEVSEQRVKDALTEQVRLAGGSSEYSNRRGTLLQAERDVAWDRVAKSTASQVEKEANAILLKIRESERVDPKLFGNLPSEAVPDPETRDMGGRFLVTKDRIQRSKVFEIATKMPKGAHLHLHFNSEIPPEHLLPYARRPEMEDTMCIRSTRPLDTVENFNEAEIVFDVFPKSTVKGNVFSSTYVPREQLPKEKQKDNDIGFWMRWVDFRRQFPGGVPLKDIKIEHNLNDGEGIEGIAEHWVREKMIITVDRAYHDRQTTNGVWACFNQGTRAFKGLLNYEGVYRWYIGQAIDSMIRDGVMYAELRPMLLDKSIPSDDGERRLGHKEQMMIVCEEIEAKRKQLEALGQLRRFPFGLKIIYCTPRSIERTRMQLELEDCIRLKLQFPDLICGFDLVGAEDRRNHIGYYADLLVAFTNTCKELRITIPFMFHAGETLIDTGGSHSPDNSNLYDALLLNAKRIGHGYSLLKHPLLARAFRDRKICLELCPISNELLHLCGNARQHIFPELLAAGLHCTLNADNPSLFSSSLSHEFYQVMVGDTRMSIHGWKQLAQWSIEHSCLKVEQQAEARKIFDEDWEEFCTWVVKAHGEYAKGLPHLE